jgi:Tol biopolymer transport system component
MALGDEATHSTGTFSGPRLTLPTSRARHPAWSPDSRKLSFTSDGVNRRPEIYVVQIGQVPINIANNHATDLFPAGRPLTSGG